MKKSSRARKRLVLWLGLAMMITVQAPVSASVPATDSAGGEDSIALKIGIGSGPGQVGYSKSMQGGGEGPEAFAVSGDTIYVSDNVNKRVNVYVGGEFKSEIPTEQSHYIRSLVAAKDNLYLMDYDGGKIDVMSVQGDYLKSVFLPQPMSGYAMQKLYKNREGTVYLSYNDDSYSIDDLANGKAVKNAGYIADSRTSYSLKRDKSTAVVQSSGSSSIELHAAELLGSAQILNADDKGGLLMELFDQVNTSKVAGEYTVRKYVQNKLAAISPISLDNYYFSPNMVLESTEQGELYQIQCFQDSVLIVKKGFLDPSQFSSKIALIKNSAQAYDQAAQAAEPSSIGLAATAPNGRTTTQSNANSLSSLAWTYNSTNAVNPDSSNVTTPDYLVGVSKPSSQTGIPYAWGGFDGITTKSSSAWTSFADAMSKGKFAGNVNTGTAGWQSGTAGFDCSGFVASAAGFTSKLSTTNLASSTYTAAVSAADILIYDLYVKSGDHVLFYTGDNGTTAINSREATTTGDDKTKAYSRTKTFLSSNNYVLRRLNGW